MNTCGGFQRNAPRLSPYMAHSLYRSLDTIVGSEALSWMCQWMLRHVPGLHPPPARLAALLNCDPWHGCCFAVHGRQLQQEPAPWPVLAQGLPAVAGGAGGSTSRVGRLRRMDWATLGGRGGGRARAAPTALRADPPAGCDAAWPRCGCWGRGGRRGRRCGGGGDGAVSSAAGAGRGTVVGYAARGGAAQPERCGHACAAVARLGQGGGRQGRHVVSEAEAGSRERGLGVGGALRCGGRG